MSVPAATAAAGEAPVLVAAKDLSKAYPLVFRRSDRLRALGRLLLGRRAPDAVPVVDGVDLEVRRGQSLGLIGENGAGKSTLLKLITGVLTASRGSVSVQGRIGALLELGAGFHSEYTGRENIATAAALYGLSPEEIGQKLPEIVAFADIGRYIDEPVKHYSSGMVVRLGFAVVAATRPDLLITDEVLAVGDESFQKKCVRWMEDYLDGGGTLILVSHSMYHVQKLCRHALWLKAGRVQAYGDVYDVTQSYLAYHEGRAKGLGLATRSLALAQGLEFGVRRMLLNGSDAEQGATLEQGSSLRVTAYIASRDGRVPVVHVGIVRADGTPVYGISSDMDGVAPQREDDGDYSITLHYPEITLLPGGYFVRVHPMDTEGVRLFDTVERPLIVRGRSRELGLVRLDHAWEQALPLPARREEQPA